MKQFKWESVVVALGLVLMGFLLKSGLQSLSAGDHSVNVRGLATRDVVADHVIWPIQIKATGSDLQALSQQLSADTKKVQDWLISNGIDAKDISLGATQLTDRNANAYSNSEMRERYLIMGVVSVSSADVEKVRLLLPRLGELMARGVPVAAADYGSEIQYDFRGLNDIKPEMIEEATKNARAAAEKFATDSGSKLGKLKSARQGLFEIYDRDSYTPYIKTVRVVTTADYYLND